MFAKNYLLVAMAASLTSPVVYAAGTQLDFSTPFSLSDAQSPDLGSAFKTKLVRLGNGMLISVFGEAVDSTKIVYDVKGDKERAARDVFVRTCASASVDCSVESNWSAPVNVSNTATLSSMTTDWQGDNGDPSAFWGDSDKPNISNGGSNLMLTWTDKYCSGGAQRSVTYYERINREVPFSCTWASYSGNAGASWSTPVQLSDGSRDAKQDSSKVNSVGKAVINWQEDPLGLQLGEAEGSGDGAAGATASNGTDIWFATTTNELNVTDATKGKPTGFTAAARLTDNLTGTASGNHGVIKDVNGAVVADSAIDGGQASATRPNVALVGPKIVVAYEETKGSNGLDTGKFIRYHNFAYTTNPSSAAGQIGCIISNPAENARRVRFVPQATPGTVSGLQMGIFWKEGKYDQGGPSDIVARLAFNGVDATNMQPVVDTNCATSDYATASTLTNAAAVNLSSNTPTATSANLSDTTETNKIENAMAHRGAIIGDDLYVGYSYTTDWALATYTSTVNYDFWMRHYDGATGTWSNPKNLSNLPSKSITVREPRLVKTPASTNEADNYNSNAFVVAWGTQTNVATHIEDPVDLDIFYTRTFDKGATYEPVVRVANPDAKSRFESQLRPTPDGLTVYAVWNESDGTNTNAVASVATTTDAPVEPTDPYEGLGEAVSSSSGGCTVTENAKFDPILPAIVLSALAFLGFRRYQRQK
ncbi:choice-of-anchor O protein [Thiomicrorhabdus sp. ZW0627]|uniref:choice-of-anchor O protein n=1 Tax=Thiomicrorhabdus sp. ZW0627 TaxID=3039774 RepID=UPI0024365B3B|nr:choice-of-anchor O protein [Thiomicrorhabdus sp. ZW0627]MDG6773836.1 choice-of-anchor O protein [Thiomicrorhabdus sp. ZW0627]